MKTIWCALLAGTMAAGCVSFSTGNPVLPPTGRSPAEVTQDQARCERYAKGQAKQQNDHYLACMIASGYRTNWDMDELGWVVGVVQTRPHEPAAVMTELMACDRRADNATSSTITPALTPELEGAITGEIKSAGFEGFNQRPRASRMLVSCLQERGYAVTPRVPYDR